MPDGGRFPLVGLGTWKLPKPQAPALVQAAIRAGYRHLDCACDYGNEPEVGAGIAAALRDGACRRDELWVTSKLWNTYHEPKHVRAACERSLRDLKLDVLDLYLVHFPIALAYVPFDVRYPPEWFFDPNAAKPAMKPINVPYADTWGAMEELQRAGLVKRIGVCNLNISMLRDLLAGCSIRPAVHQLELHPYLTQVRQLRYCQQEQIAVSAFSPLGAPSYLPLGMAQAAESVLTDPVVTSMAAAHGRTPGQIVLRWGVQRGCTVLPKTQSPARLAENLALFDFALSAGEMAAIDGLDRHRRFNDPGHFCEKAFNTFFPIFD
ncbi:aldo/keto reductase [Horticoccus sp. 23ND18S-11]|uniref:aldo/keto reductase n=1 Tax=Horticoccus sp. 23ND18S-11 TaxID=3391832 RepID=UPI0039C92DA5